jgi:glycosyltransferase involved in cell wall biosynthesis
VLPPQHHYHLHKYIVSSDVILCWFENEVEIIPSFINLFEKVKKNVMLNFHLTIQTNCLYFSDKADLLHLFEHYDYKTVLPFSSCITSNFDILYLANTSYPSNSGYTIRTKYILEELNKLKKVICFVKPRKLSQYKTIYVKNKIIYYYSNSLKYDSYLYEYVKKNPATIRTIWAASDNYNGIRAFKLKTKLKKISKQIISMYEIRGLWHYTKKHFQTLENKFDIDFFNEYDNLEKLSCEKNDVIICENKVLSEICKKRYHVHHEKILLFPNSIDGNYQCNKTQSISFQNKNKITFGYIGSIVSYEGICNLICQFKKLCTTYANIKLLIVGGGATLDAEKTIPEIIKNSENCNQIQYVGQVAHEIVDEYYKQIDVICIPRLDVEVCNIVAPLKPFEAMMRGKIVLCSSVDALSEIIQHGHNGIVFDKKNLNDLYTKMKSIVEDEYDLDKIIDNSFQYCKENTWEKNCKNILTEVYNKLANIKV